MIEAQITHHDLVPLPFAARVVYLLAHGLPLPEEHLMERLNGLAYSLAGETTLYAVDGEQVRALRKAELADGLFRNGAAEFQFIDERPPIQHIGVTRDGVEKTAVRVAEALEIKAAQSGRKKKNPG